MSRVKRILVVEDAPLICETLQQKLSDLGYKVDTLLDGQDVLDTYLPGKYDLLLMDTQMERSIGYEICAKLRKRDQEIIIIGMSSVEGFRSQWMEAGATAFSPTLSLVRDVEKTLQQYLK